MTRQQVQLGQHLASVFRGQLTLKKIFLYLETENMVTATPPPPPPPLLYYCNLWERVCVVQWGMLTVLKEQVNFVLIATQEGKNKLLSFSPERVETIFQYDCCYFYCYF